MEFLSALIRSLCHPTPRSLEQSVYVTPLGEWTW